MKNWALQANYSYGTNYLRHQFSLANCVILNGVDKGPDLCILDLNPIAVAERQTVRGDVPSCVETPTSGN